MAERRCPQCGAATGWQGNPHRPFCSERCRLIDLGAWLGERYAVPGDPVSEASEQDSGVFDGTGDPARKPRP